MQAELGIAIAALVGAFAAAAVGTWTVWRYMIRWRVLDRPNERSAHQIPTPTLGGLGLILGFWVGAGLLAWAGHWSPAMTGWAAAMPLLLLFTFDDAGRPLKGLEKILLQVLAAGVWLYWGPALEWITLPGLGRVELGAWSWPCTIFWFVWLCNAYNFMDGLDGLTASQAALLSAGLGLALWFLGSPLWIFAWVLASAAGGFLVFNWPPARLFMGDVGSTFLGFSVAALGLVGERAGLPLWLCALMGGYFLFDTAYTFSRRLWAGEPVWQAHRKHLYQRLDKMGWPAGRIDLGAAAVTTVAGVGGLLYLNLGWESGAVLLALAVAALALAACSIERRNPEFD